ncbi:MAG: DNA polymerase III subunit delta [Anaerolineae bacterium]|nr:DNA polymerase III subunit delta [Anaerolineae bacterium]
MSQPNPTFYIFHGSDEFTRSETVAELERRLGAPETADLNTTWLDGDKITFAELCHACETVPFLAERRMVLVTGLLSRLERGKGDQGLVDALAGLLPALPETTRLILIEEKTLSNNHPIVKLAQDHERGYVRLFELPKRQHLPRWIVQRVEKEGGEIELAAAHQLAQVIGDDLRLLAQETGKLVAYAGGERAITAADVALLVPYMQEAIIFDLVDALGQRNGQVASSTLQQLLDKGENPQGIFLMIVRQFRLLIQTKELSQQGENHASIATILGIHPFPARKLYGQAQNFTPAQLERIYRYLRETDLQIKSGQLAAEVALDLLVAGLVGEDS